MELHDEPIPSRAAIAGHTIHLMPVSFPITFLVGGLLTDIPFLIPGDTFQVHVSLWLIARRRH